MCSPLQAPPKLEESWVFIAKNSDEVPPDMLDVAELVRTDDEGIRAEADELRAENGARACILL